MKIFGYRVRYYEEGEGMLNAQGYCVGENRTDAIEHIEAYYGKDSIDNVLLCSLECGDGVFVTRDENCDIEELSLNDLVTNAFKD